jgi:hypothetical protein
MTRSRPRSRSAILLAGVAALIATGLGPVFLLVTWAAGSASSGGGCAAPVGTLPVTAPVPGRGASVGASEYGGPGDPSSGTVGSSGVDLATHPDSYAELGGTSFQTATAMGGLPYETPLRISYRGRSVIAYKRDIGLGGGPVDGLARRIDLWWQLAAALGAPYEDGLWSGAVRIERPPVAGAGDVLGQARAVSLALPEAGAGPVSRRAMRRAARAVPGPSGRSGSCRRRRPRGRGRACSPTGSPPLPRARRRRSGG